MYTAQSMKNQWAQGGALGSLQSGEGARDGGMDEDQDSIKETMLDIYQYLLGFTFAESVVHIIFEFLVFIISK